MRANKILVAALVTTASVGLWAAAAAAHVTIDPSSAPQGAGDQVLTFRVPNEDASANTTQLDVQLPVDQPIAVVDPLVMQGWTATTKTTHVATPIQTDDGTFSDVVTQVTWKGGTIPPHAYGEFKILAQGLPKTATSLTFKAIQTYDNGTSVAWVETAANASHPAPVLQLTPATPAAAASSKSSTESSTGLAVAALIVGALGLIVAVGAVARIRRGSAHSHAGGELVASGSGQVVQPDTPSADGKHE